MPSPAIIDWLLEGDPAIGWQVKRDLLDAPESEVAAERGRVATEGWGATLLAAQDPEGTWAKGLYNPKWTSTFYTLLTLRNLGLDHDHPAPQRGAAILIERGLCNDGGLTYNSPMPSTTIVVAGRELSVRKGRAEACITGMGLAIAACFRHPADELEPLLGYVLREQLADGGWNCRAWRGDTHSSFNTTISTLEGLLEWERYTGSLEPRLADARERCHEFLFQHSLYRSHRTGAVAHPSFTKFPFPPQWHYDALRGLDYLRAANAPRDPRIEPAIELLNRARRADGCWKTYAPYRGAEWVRMEGGGGGPSRWNTLRALRVLRWWDGRDTA
jgi:hypothetical protein